MYVDSEKFPKPDDHNVKVWRYMDFPKFISLISTKHLFFSSIKTLRLQDNFEGIFSRIARDQNPFLDDGNDIRKWLNDLLIPRICINCWHINEYESVAMWDLYSRYSQGIAIQSTFNQLSSSFDTTERTINIGMVKYIDYSNESNLSLDQPMSVILHKRKSYEFERELRAVVIPDELLPKTLNGKTIPVDGAVMSDFIRTGGVYVPVNINRLISKIYLYPKTPKWVHDTIISALEKYEIEKNVVQSDLDEDPLK